MRKRIVILGSTGSIGTQALEVVSELRECFEVVGLSGGSNVELLRKQIKEFHPELVCIADDAWLGELENEFPDTMFLSRDEGLVELCSADNIDLVLVAVSGKIGLKPTIAAIESGIDVALANKETLVMAGEMVMGLAKRNGVNILPVDSEHSAIHQCLKNVKEIKKLVITASGGPFRDKTIEAMKSATKEQTLAHPRWAMGKKITVDSATLMNKGLEVIEACYLFNVAPEAISVIVHPQSIVHSAIEYIDGSIIAQLGVPSMHIPIQYALCYPNRFEGIKTDSFDFVSAGRLDFEPVDYEKFPCLQLAFDVLKRGQSAQIVLNAANEEAVLAFLDGNLSLYDIYKVVKFALDTHNDVQIATVDEIFALDESQRLDTRSYIESMKVA